MKKTKKELIKELEKRYVPIGISKNTRWVKGTGFDFKSWSKSEVEQLYKGSKKRK